MAVKEQPGALQAQPHHPFILISKSLIILRAGKMIMGDRSRPILLSLKGNKRVANIKSTCIPVQHAGTKYSIIRDVLLEQEYQFEQNGYSLIWTDHALSLLEIRAQPQGARVNHFPQIKQLTRKDKMARNLNALKAYFPKQYDFYPQTWSLPLDYQSLMKQHSYGQMYICKPENGCQGQGIFLIDSPAKLDPTVPLVVQEYMSSPLLIDGLKFDLRIYVLITSVTPLRVFLYEDGIARFATEPFQTANKDNLCNSYSHLTNYAINKTNEKFKVDEDNRNQGHKRLISSLFPKPEWQSLKQKLSPIILKTIISCLPHIQNSYSQCKRTDPSFCFQLLGFDILLNDKNQPYLLQVNQNPSLVTDTQLDYQLKHSLVHNILQLVTGGYNIPQDQKAQYRIRMKDRHQNALQGNFTKIYPCPTLQETQQYDEYMSRANSTFRSRFGSYSIRTVSRQSTCKPVTQTSWLHQPDRYTSEKLQAVYLPRERRSSHRARVLERNR